jgi:hypothetical protein
MEGQETSGSSTRNARKRQEHLAQLAVAREKQWAGQAKKQRSRGRDYRCSRCRSLGYSLRTCKNWPSMAFRIRRSLRTEFNKPDLPLDQRLLMRKILREAGWGRKKLPYGDRQVIRAERWQRASARRERETARLETLINAHELASRTSR